MKTRHALAATLTLLAAPPGPLAQERSAAFLDLASRVPAALLAPDPGTSATVAFADHRAAAAALSPLPPGAEPDWVARFGPWMRLQSPPFGDYLERGLDGGWEARLGFGPFDLDAHLSVTAPPAAGLLFRLSDGAERGVLAALRAQGYAKADRDGLRALARGAEDHGIDPAARDPADPFGGPMGRASRVALDGTLLLQANEWPLLLDLAGAGGPQGHPHLGALAAALDDPAWGEVALVQAVLLPSQADLTTGRTPGVPPWTIGLLADLGSGDATVTLVLLAYPDPATAETAARRLREGWAEAPAATAGDRLLAQALGPDAAGPLSSLRDATGAEAETGAAGSGPFVAWLALRAPPGSMQGRPGNLPFLRLYATMLRGELSLLGLP